MVSAILDHMVFLGFCLILFEVFSKLITLIFNIIQIPFAVVSRTAVYIVLVFRTYFLSLFSAVCVWVAVQNSLSPIPFLIVLACVLFGEIIAPYKNNEDAWGSDKFHNNLGEMLADSENKEIHNLSKNDKQTLLNMFTLDDIEIGTYLGDTPVSSIFTNILKPDTSNPQSVIDSIDLRHYYIGRLNASPNIVNKESVKTIINTPLKETLENISDTETIKNIIITKGEGSIPWLEEQLKDIVGDNYSETVGGVLFEADGELEADENYDLYASSKKEEDEEEEDN